MRFILFVILCLASAHVAGAHPEDPTKTTYLGNEGIMVSDGHTRILFDPLFPNGFGTYQMVPEDMRDAIMAGEAPYHDVDAIFISHMHPDHFSVGEIIAYLEAHERVQLYAPAQAVDWMREETTNEAIFERVTAVPLERLDAPLSYSQGTLDIDVVRIPHAGWPGRADVSNLVWRVTLGGGLTVVHLRDADPNDSHYSPYAEHWRRTTTTMAYPPYWFFTSGDGPMILETRLNAQAATGIHVPINLPADLFISGADFFHDPGETRQLEAEGRE